jgi:mono/diheme cytochrome c family protein
MKRNSAPVYLFLALAVGLSCFAAFAQDKTIRKVPPKPTTATSGKELFRQYCAVCHGEDGKGAGPAASALKPGPSDLTQLSRKSGGRFPESRVLATFKGEASVAAHGSADMPIWGPIFSKMNSNPSQGQDRIYALLHYTEEIQAK